MLGGLGILVVHVALTVAAPDLEAAAAADGYQRLMDRLLSPSAPTGQTPADLVNADPQAERTLRQAVYDVSRRSPTRWYSDGSCEVDVTVALADLRERVPPNTAAAAALTALDGESLAAVGTAGPPPVSNRSVPPAPEGWESVTPEGIELAAQAAQQDCVAQLIRRIEQLRITETENVRSVLIGPPSLSARLTEYLEPVAFSAPQYEPIQVCSVRGSVSMDAVVAALKKLARNHRGFRRLAAADFDQLPSLNPQKMIEAVGYGVPPIRHCRGLRTASNLTPPDWASTTLRATGRGGQPESLEGTAQGKLRAAQAAGADARLKLGRRIDALPLPPDGTVTIEEFLTEHRDLDRDVATFLRSMGKVETRWDATGQAEVVMEIPLSRLWTILAPHVASAATATTTSRPAPSTQRAEQIPKQQSDND